MKIDLDNILKNEIVKEEYRTAFLLNMFRKLCSKMEKDKEIKDEIKALFRQTFDSKITTKLVVEKYIGFSLDDEDATIVEKWIRANLYKNDRRIPISGEIKNGLYKKQNGRCQLCGEDLDLDWSKIHVDHIIPWKLVGDELEDNYQLLCSVCNESKSAKTDYIFKYLIMLG